MNDFACIIKCDRHLPANHLCSKNMWYIILCSRNIHAVSKDVHHMCYCMDISLVERYISSVIGI